MVTIKCAKCGQEFERRKGNLNPINYCSKDCWYKRRDWTQVEKKYGGKVARANEIGKKAHGQMYIWHACLSCGKRRWVQIKKSSPSSLLCYKCSSNTEKGLEVRRIANYKGGRCKNSNGYIQIALPKGSPYFSMRNATTYVMEHRLIMAQSLGRCLRDDEIVHHLNGVREDNRLSNLLLVSPDKHNNIIPAMQKKIQELESRLRQQGHLI